MSSANLMIALGNLLASAASVTLTDGALDTGYALSDLWNGNPAAGVRFTTTHAQIDVDHGAPVALPFAQLVHTNLRSTATATIQRSSDVAFGTTPIDEDFTLTDAAPDGLRDNPCLAPDTTAYQYTRIILTGNDVAILLGQIQLAASLEQLTINISDAPTLTPAFKTTVLTTNADVTFRTKKGTRRWMFKGAVKATDTAGLAQLLRCFETAQGMAEPVGVVWDASINAAWFGIFSSDALPYVPTFMRDANDVTLAFEELARGQVWP